MATPILPATPILTPLTLSSSTSASHITLPVPSPLHHDNITMASQATTATVIPVSNSSLPATAVTTATISSSVTQHLHSHPPLHPHTTAALPIMGVNTVTMTPVKIPVTNPINLAPSQLSQQRGKRKKNIAENGKKDVNDKSEGSPPPNTIQHLLEEQDLKKKRLARKAELARMSRRRKKMRLVDLEEEVARLKSELEQTKLQNQSALESIQKQQAQQEKTKEDKTTDGKHIIYDEDANLERCIQDIMTTYAQLSSPSPSPSSSSSPPPTLQSLISLVEEMGKICDRRNLNVDFHLKSMEKALAPTMSSKFLSWIMTQNDKFYTDPTGLWTSVFSQEVGLSSEQMKELMNIRNNFKSRKPIIDIDKAFENLNVLFRQQVLDTKQNLDGLKSVLSPEQMAKFFKWVNTFGHICIKINT